MVQSAISTILIFSTLSFGVLGVDKSSNQAILSEHSISLNNRQPDTYVNGVFKDNILLNLAYLKGSVKNAKEINWDEIRRPQTFEFKLEPGQTFAFHDNVLPEFKDRVVRTTNAHFNYNDGFKSDGYLTGDGVCHFASLIYWVAKDANLDTKAPTNHNFMAINEISKEYGVSIFNSGVFGNSGDALQNLYITNNQDKAISIKFEFDGVNLKSSVSKEQ